MPFIAEYKDPFSGINFKTIRYTPKKTVDLIELIHSNFEKLLQQAHFDEKMDLAEIEKNVKELKKGAVVYIDEGRDAQSFHIERYDIEKMKAGSHGFYAYDIHLVEESVKKIRSYEKSKVEVGDDFLKKLENVEEKKILRVNTYDWLHYLNYIKDREGKRFFASKAFKDEVERVYNEAKAKL